MRPLPKEITKGSQLLTKKEVEALEPKDRLAYDKLANAFIAEFNTLYPDGKVVKVPIQSIVVGNDDRVNFVVGAVDNLSTQSIGLPFVVVDRIAENLGCGNAEGLMAVAHSTLEPLMVQMTVRGVVAGDIFETKDGQKKYQIPAIVKLPETREEIVLSDDAADIIAEMQKIVLKEAIMSSSRRSRKPVKGAKAPTVPAAEEDAEV